jgi:ATP-dependent Lon protease
MKFTEKLQSAFKDTTVYKDPKIIAVFKAASIPSFLRDWILKRKSDLDGKIHDVEALQDYIYDIIPRRDDLLTLQSAARNEGRTKKFLAKIEVQFSVRGNCYTFAIPDLGLHHSQTLIEDYVYQRIQSDVERTSGGWGLVQLGYIPPGEGEPGGVLTLLEYKNFCPYEIKLDAFKTARAEFTAEEWMDVVLGAIDYNPDGYENWLQKHTMLTRLLPFVEPRVNLVELAPKGTGKSYLFGQVGKYGWQVSGGTLTRAKMFGDINGKAPGMVSGNDFVALDEVQSITFNNPGEMQGGLKAYMESGKITVGKHEHPGTAGIILLGNILQDEMDESKDMFRKLPDVFHEAALLDRFHGFIRGRDIPRMSESLKINNWALNSEYFSEIMHMLHQPDETLLYRHVVQELVDYPKGADTRDTEAVMRLCTAYLKLFFPHFTTADKVDTEEFNRYCLRPAVQMRRIIRTQLQIIDPAEYGGKNMAVYALKGSRHG